MDNSSEIKQEIPSNFVTVLAWIFIVITGFACFISILQNAMIFLFMPIDQIAASAARDQHNGSGFPIFMFQYMRWIFVLFFVVTLTAFVTSISLLKRKNWARIVFIGILGFGILWNILGLAFQLYVSNKMSTLPSNAPPDFAENFEMMTKVIMYISAGMALGISILFGWIIKRLRSAVIKSEFC